MKKSILYIAWMAISILIVSSCLSNLSAVSDVCRIKILDHEIIVQNSFGGAVSADYLTIHIDGELYKMWKIADSVILDKIAVDDSLFISFANPVYFQETNENKTSLVVALPIIR